MKQIIKMFLCLLAVFGITTALAPQTVFAYDFEINGVQYTVKQGNAEVSGYSGIGGEVIIPDTVEGYTVTTIGDAAFYNCTSLTGVTIPDSVTNIERRAFERCSGLTSVIIGNGVTTIGETAFGFCTNLQNVTIGNSVTTIGDEAFYWCPFSSVTIPDSVTNIGNSAFETCDGLSNVAIPDSVTSVGERAFMDCANLTNVTIGNKVTIIRNSTFKNCVFLKNVTIPDSVTTIGDEAFSSCINLTTINYGGSKAQWAGAIANATDWNYDHPSDQVINYGAWDVKITAGANMAATSGEPVQAVKKGADMAFVTFTAATGFYFPADYSVPNLPDGFSVTRNNDGTQITVSGKPNADTEFTLPDPLHLIVTAITVTAQDIISGSDETISISMTPSDVTGTVVLTIKEPNGNVKSYNITLTAEDQGKKSISLRGLAVGQYTVKAEYPGSNVYAPVSGTAAFTVKEKLALTITAKNQTYIYNGKTQGPGDTAHNDPAEIARLIDVEGLQAGDFVYSIIVDGQRDIIGESELVPQSAVIYDSNNKPVTDNYNISYVNGTLSIVHVIDVSAADISRGDTETIEVTTPKDATGTVTLKIKYPDDSEKTYSVAMTAGKGQLELEDLPVGAYDVTAEYSIDPNAPESQRYADDSNTASFKVTEKPVTTFTVSFDANGGSGKMEKVTGVSGEYTLPECTFTAPDDKAFDCWMVGNDTFAPGDKIAVDADTTVTAQWKDAPPVHVHTPDLVEAKEATCTEEGNTAYYVCTGCGLWFEDKTALVEIADKSSVIIRPTGHKWDDGVVTKEPTYTKAGIRTYTCLNDSSHKKEEVIPKKQRSSGGGSSSSSSGGSVSGKRSAGGSWSQDASGWHYKENGVLLKNAWKYLPYNGVSYWYYFDETGTMKTGWLEQNGNRYYLYPVSDGWMGRMVTGWQQIEGKWYFFETASGKDQGRMYRSERTPDRYYTGPDGAWDGNPAEQGA